MKAMRLLGLLLLCATGLAEGPPQVQLLPPVSEDHNAEAGPPQKKLSDYTDEELDSVHFVCAGGGKLYVVTGQYIIADNLHERIPLIPEHPDALPRVSGHSSEVIGYCAAKTGSCDLHVTALVFDNQVIEDLTCSQRDGDGKEKIIPYGDKGSGKPAPSYYSGLVTHSVLHPSGVSHALETALTRFVGSSEAKTGLARFEAAVAPAMRALTPGDYEMARLSLQSQGKKDELRLLNALWKKTGPLTPLQRAEALVKLSLDTRASRQAVADNAPYDMQFGDYGMDAFVKGWSEVTALATPAQLQQISASVRGPLSEIPNHNFWSLAPGLSPESVVALLRVRPVPEIARRLDDRSGVLRR